MSQMTSETAQRIAEHGDSAGTLAAKASPIAAIGSLQILGVDLSTWVLIFNGIYVLLLIGDQVWKMYIRWKYGVRILKSLEGGENVDIADRRKGEPDKRLLKVERRKRESGQISPAMMRVLTAAMVIAIPAEGLRQYAYYDPVGILTVCYGHTATAEKGRFYPLEECKKLLSSDMLKSVMTVEHCAPQAPESVKIAFSDAVFNLGSVIACDVKDSAAARLLKAGEWELACKQLPRWNKGTIAGQKVTLPGLIARRAKELDVCLSGLG